MNQKDGDLVFHHAAAGGIKMDVPRLLVEWACIISVSGAAWWSVRLKQIAD